MSTDNSLYAVMHCTKKEFKKLEFLGRRVLKFGMYVNTDIYDNIAVDKGIFATDLTSLSDLITECKSNFGKIPERTQVCERVFGNLKLNLEYAKPICIGDAVLITKSGYDSNRIAEKHSLPEMVVIKKIIEGKEKGTYQVLLEHKSTPDDDNTTPKPHDDTIKYYIEIAPTLVNPVKWTLKDGGLTINDIIFTDIVPQVQIYVRVYGKNAAGKGQVSNPVPFTPQ